MKRLTLEHLEHVSGGDGDVPSLEGLPSNDELLFYVSDLRSPYDVDQSLAPDNPRSQRRSRATTRGQGFPPFCQGSPSATKHEAANQGKERLAVSRNVRSVGQLLVLNEACRRQSGFD